MRTLEEAWAWYQGARRLLRLVRRMGDLYWTDLPWGVLERDEHFKHLEAEVITRDADAVLAEFDDVAVFVLFSVFEATVRDHLVDDITQESSNITHPALAKAAQTLSENVKEGSFYNNVLTFYKGLDHDLVERVSQVRGYRNWVAHGRRPERRPETVTPRVAFDRLSEFLVLIGHRPATAGDGTPPTG